MQPIDTTRLATQIADALSDASLEADEVVVITFHIDDQTPEDLSIGLDRLRATDGVLDVSTAMVGGKKGRLGFRVEVLARPLHAPIAIRACLAQTTTIGLRWQLTQRITLRREVSEQRSMSGRSAAVKVVVRPGGQLSTKLEADDAAALGLDYVERQRIRKELEFPPEG